MIELKRPERIPTNFIVNPFTGEVVSQQPNRGGRPWNGARTAIEEEVLGEHEVGCYLCPGEPRTTGEHNPFYRQGYIFKNDFPAIVPVEADPAQNATHLDRGIRNLFPGSTIPSRFLSLASAQYAAQQEVQHEVGRVEQHTYSKGTCEVVVFSPRHNRDMIHMTTEEITHTLKMIQEQRIRLTKEGIQYVLFFINKGKEVGNSLLHPHGQTYGYPMTPPIAQTELEHQKKYFEEHGVRLLEAFFTGNNNNAKENRRKYMLFENEHFMWIMPPWATWPAETMVIPKTHVSDINMLTDDQMKDLSVVLQIVTKTYGVAYMAPQNGAQYSMEMHQAPTDGKQHDYQDFHLDFITPLRAPGLTKYMWGAEKGGMRTRDSKVSDWVQYLRDISQHIIDAGINNANLQIITDYYFHKDGTNTIKRNPDIHFPF